MCQLLLRYTQLCDENVHKLECDAMPKLTIAQLTSIRAKLREIYPTLDDVEAQLAKDETEVENRR
jgi:hypothetical protein